jgi:hypothetical protein
VIDFPSHFLDGIDLALLTCIYIVHSKAVLEVNGRSEEGTMAAKKKAVKKVAKKKTAKKKK